MNWLLPKISFGRRLFFEDKKITFSLMILCS